MKVETIVREYTKLINGQPIQESTVFDDPEHKFSKGGTLDFNTPEEIDKFLASLSNQKEDNLELNVKVFTLDTANKKTIYVNMRNVKVEIRDADIIFTSGDDEMTLSREYIDNIAVWTTDRMHANISIFVHSK